MTDGMARDALNCNGPCACQKSPQLRRSSGEIPLGDAGSLAGVAGADIEGRRLSGAPALT